MERCSSGRNLLISMVLNFIIKVVEVTRWTFGRLFISVLRCFVVRGDKNICC